MASKLMNLVFGRRNETTPTVDQADAPSSDDKVSASSVLAASQEPSTTGSLDVPTAESDKLEAPHVASPMESETAELRPATVAPRLDPSASVVVQGARNVTPGDCQLVAWKQDVVASAALRQAST